MSTAPVVTAEHAAPAHTNRLIHATSPYLLQHAHNPVDWFPWGAEALAKAATEDKPIFLSIGYSACHWCHVMERESFESADVAAILNAHFVAIKVDREERPDLDQIYMNATMLYNQGQGGWPMSVFLAPDQRPFFAGTYFPPDSRYGRPGFSDLLLTIARLWREDRGRIMQSAESLSSAVQQYGAMLHSEAGIARELVGRVADGLGLAFDDVSGGLSGGGTNKFPPSMAMSLMLREYYHSRKLGRPKDGLLEKVELTLDRMAAGGIYDHLGGGICRYSTDTEWLVPHFEKMLYDQALVSSVYLEAAQVTGQDRWAAVARDIFDYVLRDLRSPEGGFYSARDADSEGVEGKFYVWSKDEVMSVLGPEVGPLFCSYYGVSASGNWEGLNILHVERELDVVAKLNSIAPDKLRGILETARKKLFDVRERRVPPGLDDKVLTSWNALMIAALARGGRVTGERRYVSAAAAAADFILTRMTADGRLLRTYRHGKAHIHGYLDDHAFFVEALLDLYEATFEPRWLNEAVRFNDDMVRHFWDGSAGGFFFTADDAEPLIVRTKETHDGAIPAGNSVALMNLLRLAALFDRQDLRDLAEQLMRSVAGSVEQSPFGFDRFLAGVDFYYGPPREVVIAGALADPATRALIEVVDRVYDPSRVVLSADPNLGVRSPLVAGKSPMEGRPAAYVCRDRACLPPVTDPGELRRLLETS